MQWWCWLLDFQSTSEGNCNLIFASNRSDCEETCQRVAQNQNLLMQMRQHLLLWPWTQQAVNWLVETTSAATVRRNRISKIWVPMETIVLVKSRPVGISITGHITVTCKVFLGCDVVALNPCFILGFFNLCVKLIFILENTENVFPIQQKQIMKRPRQKDP